MPIRQQPTIRKILPNQKSEAEWRFLTRNTVNDLADLLQDLSLYDLGDGTTAQRPVATKVGARYFDTTLGYQITWNGTVWKNGAGATV